MEEKSDHSYLLEKQKLASDYLKHLTTLSTGSIILLAAFLEKLFAQPLWRPLIVLSFLGFILSVIASVAAFSVVLYIFPASEIEAKAEMSESHKTMWALSLLGTWIGFLIGIISFTIFVIRNLLK